MTWSLFLAGARLSPMEGDHCDQSRTAYDRTLLAQDITKIGPSSGNIQHMLTLCLLGQLLGDQMGQMDSENLYDDGKDGCCFAVCSRTWTTDYLSVEAGSLLPNPQLYGIMLSTIE